MREEYASRLAARRTAAERHEAEFRTVGNWRLFTAVAGAVLVWYNFWLLPLPIAGFAVLMVIHERIQRHARGERRAAAWYQRALDRLDGRWDEAGETGDRFHNPDHPYAGDLDVLGRGSLFQLVNSARTLAGEETLARWLLAPSPAPDVLLRHGAIQELKDRLDLREDLALLGDDVRSELHAAAITHWGAAPPAGVPSSSRIVAALITAGLLITFFGYMFQLWTLAPLMVVILVELLFVMSVRRHVAHILGAVDMPSHDLAILAELLGRFERENLQSPLLAGLSARITTEGRPASRQIAKLRQLIEWRDQSRNQFFAIAAEPLLWSYHFAFAIERWRQISGPHIGEWIEAVGEIEALSSLAGYTAERPDDVFPDLASDGPLFHGEAICHPLLASCVPNDVRLDREMQLLLVSGSNMSGKSTLMRSVGLNTVLAWAGAPVRARSLRVSYLTVGASMRVQDSIQDGKSRFYAEITRLRQIVDLSSGEPPLLFLLDEVLSGTNSHDRLIGAEAVVRTLVRNGAIGLVTTHDLALSHIADDLAPRAANVHFEDHIEHGRIAFDYRMRPGVVQKSNALALMRSVGLEV